MTRRWTVTIDRLVVNSAAAVGGRLRLLGLVAVLLAVVPWGERGTGLICAQHPADPSRKLTPSPFPQPQSAKLTAQQRAALLEQLEDQIARADDALGQRDFEAASAAGESVLALERQLLGEVHADVAATLTWLGEMREQAEDFAAAQSWYNQALVVTRNLYGPDDWRTRDARLAAENVQMLGRLNAADRRRLAEAHRQHQQAVDLYAQAKYREAISLFREILQTRRQVLGGEHADTAATLNNLARLYTETGELAEAEQAAREALAVREQVYGQHHPRYATSLGNLAGVYDAQGQYARAETLLRQVLEIIEQTYGKEHEDYALGLNNLAGMYDELGDYARAEPLYQQAIELRKRVVGEDHPDYALSLNNLAVLYKAMGDYARAEPLLRRAMEIFRLNPGADHPDYAMSLNNLALLYWTMSRYEDALPLAQRAFEINRRLGEDHPIYATSLNTLAGLLDAAGQDAHAEPLYRRALKIKEQVLGREHPSYARTLNNLAVLQEELGRYDQAEAFYRQSLEIRKGALGPTHPRYGVSLSNLAALLSSLGRYEEAEPLMRQALEIQRENLDASFAVLSQRQQLAMTDMTRYSLDGYLSLSASAPQFNPQAHFYVLAWKGAVFARQRQLRLAAGQGELAPLLERLQATSRQLSKLTFAVPAPQAQGAWRRRLAELSESLQRQEAELARRSAALHSAALQSADTEVTLRQLQAALGEEVALVDFLEYWHFGPAERRAGILPVERRMTAFVVRKNRPLVRLDLGPVDPIAKAIEIWRGDYGGSDQGATAANELRRQIWQPLEPHLEGASTVAISPDGALTRFPLAALPGTNAGSYLLEERALVVVAVPRLLASMAAPSAAAAEPSLLALGDVDYDRAEAAAVNASPGTTRGVPSRGQSLRFDRLDQTRAEVTAVCDSFRSAHADARLRLLERRQASEERLREEISRHRYLHLATHGFFAPAKLRSAFAPPVEMSLRQVAALGDGGPTAAGNLLTYHPGLLSGLALAGVNEKSKADGDDGILTAEEVATLDLRGVELVVLSACETGLGDLAGGEGVLGLQRAFQVSGSGAVMASLWNVDDRATRVLMQQFYENLWTKKMSKAEALRQAQIAMLDRYQPRDGTLRGLADVDRPSTARRGDRLPPQFWAAFVLSGDWR